MDENFERRIEKLPQWVQRYIGKLRRDNAALRAERGKVADGDTKITFRVTYDENYSIPDRAKVTFRLENGTIEFSLRNDEVRVHSSRYCLVAKPSASNAISLSVQR